MTLEPLERRRMFAYTPSVLADGVLVLQGTAGDDAGVLVQNAGTVELDSVPQHFLDANNQPIRIKAVVVNMGSGANGIDVDTTNIPVLINGGNYGGTQFDFISVVNRGTTVVVNARGGDDTVIIDDAGTVGSLVLGGDGNDTVEVHRGSASASNRTWVFGGNGADFLYGPGSQTTNFDDLDGDGVFEQLTPGTGYVTLYGDDGNDWLFSSNLDTRLDGGRGTDTAVLLGVTQEQLAATGRVSRVEDFEFVVLE